MLKGLTEHRTLKYSSLHNLQYMFIFYRHFCAHRATTGLLFAIINWASYKMCLGTRPPCFREIKNIILLFSAVPSAEFKQSLFVVWLCWKPFNHRDFPFQQHNELFVIQMKSFVSQSCVLHGTQFMNESDSFQCQMCDRVMLIFILKINHLTDAISPVYVNGVNIMLK